jgi:hypothetical protein
VEQIDLPFTEPVRANPGTQWKEVITLRRLAEKGELIAQARPGEYKSNTWYSSFNGLFLHPPPPLLPANSLNKTFNAHIHLQYIVVTSLLSRMEE